MPAHSPRRRLLVLTGAAGLAACALPPPAPLRLLHLPATPAQDLPASGATLPEGQRWQLMAPVQLPDYLDRDTLLQAQGAAALQAVPGVRWAEPLRDAVPRVLRDDLARLLGEDRVWAAPLPAGLQITHQLRVAVLALHAQPDAQVLLAARWSLARADGARPPLGRRTELRVRATDPAGPDALALAHRELLWRLAQAMALTRV